MHTKKSAVFFFFLLLFVYQNKALSSASFENTYNCYGGNQIEYFQICGERCSGTNFISCLIKHNFSEITHSSYYGHKHYLWWFGSENLYDEATVETKLSTLRYPPEAIHLDGSSSFLFVIVVRDPYDWIRSFFLQPHETHKSVHGKGFFNFLSGQWRAADEPAYEQESYKVIENLNPWTNRPFANVLELRKYKMQNYLSIRNLVENYVLVRYEDVRKDPEGFVRFLSMRYNLKSNDTFTPITAYKGTDVPYKRKNYFSFTPGTLSFINENIDWSVERELGYKKKAIKIPSHSLVFFPE